jgi:hypothetical protein
MKYLGTQGKAMFCVVHYIPKERVEKRVIAAVANFESDDEVFIRDLFNTTYVGQEIVFISSFSSTQLAQKHVADNGHYIESMETLFLPIADRGIGVKEQVLPLFQ